MSNSLLLVDCFEPWRSFVCSIVEKKRGLKIVGAVSDGLVAVRKATELKPDLVLLEIGLPNLNGIQTARRIRLVSPNSKIVFLSVDNSPDVVQAALSTGAHGFVHKACAQRRLLPIIRAVLRNRNRVPVSSPKDTFDIFAGSPDQDATWLEAVVGLREARERMQEIASESPGVHFVFHSPSLTVEAQIDTSLTASREEGLLETGTG